MLKLIIGNKVYSSWSLRGWLAARQSGLPFEEVTVSLFDEAWPARKVQPDLAPSAGKVPVLWDGATAVWDSFAIIDYLDTLSGGTRFWPLEPAALGLARAMAAEMHAGYMPLRQAYGMNLRHILPAAPQRRGGGGHCPHHPALDRGTHPFWRRGRRFSLRRLWGGGHHVRAGRNALRHL